MENKSEYKRAHNLEVHESDDGLIVFNPATDKVHHLNYTSGVLFEACQSTQTFDELTSFLKAFYAPEEVSAESVQAGVQKLLDEGVLIEAGND